MTTWSVKSDDADHTRVTIQNVFPNLLTIFFDNDNVSVPWMQYNNNIDDDNDDDDDYDDWKTTHM